MRAIFQHSLSTRMVFRIFVLFILSPSTRTHSLVIALIVYTEHTTPYLCVIIIDYHQLNSYFLFVLTSFVAAVVGRFDEPYNGLK